MIRTAVSILSLAAILSAPPAGMAESITEYSELFGELSPEQHRILMEYEDHRLNPVDNWMEEFLNIPGFPPELAARIVRMEKSHGDSWFEHLKPRERRILTRYSRWIELPSAGDRFGADTRFSVRHRGSARRERFYISIRAGGCSGLYRSEISEARKIGAAMVKASLAGDAVSFYGGDFCPDIPLGLLSSSSSFSYQYSSSYPMRNYRFIGAGTGFYGSSIRGAAVQLKGSFFRTACFAGSVRKYDFTHGEEKTAGAVLGLSHGSWRYGGALLEIDEFILRGIHFRYRPDELLDIGMEAAFSKGGDSAWSAALKYSRKGFRAGFILYSVESGFRSRMGRIPGSGTAVNGQKRGMGFTARKRLWRGFYAALCSGGMIRRKSFSSERKVSAGVRLDARRKGSSLVLEWKYSSSRRKDDVPYPPVQPETEDIKGQIKSIINLRLWKKLRLRTSCRYVYGTDCGVMIFPSSQLSIFNGSLQADLGAAFYRSIRGRPLFHAYIPSARGSYPWKYLSGSGRFPAARISLKLRNLSICISINAESGEKPGSDVQISALF